jgi:hypothetical protein
MSISENPAAISASPTTSDQRRSKPVKGSVLDLLEVPELVVVVSVFAATPLDEVVGVVAVPSSLEGEVPLFEGVVVVVGGGVVVVVGGGVVVVVVVGVVL